jgi:hypothetical protein
MSLFELLIPKRPVSLQAKRRGLQAWKAFVHEHARKAWDGQTVREGDLQFTVVYLCEESPPDTDNIVKPIQDALVGLVFSDDSLIADVECHRRFLNATFDLTRLPALVIAGIAANEECVYVKCRSLDRLSNFYDKPGTQRVIEGQRTRRAISPRGL